MKSGGPWNLRGLRPEAREAARMAARRSGMSVGEWLNNVIASDDEDADDAPALFADVDDEPQDEAPRYSRPDDRERRIDSANRRREKRDQDFARETADTRDDLTQVNSRLDKLSQQLERMSRSEGAPPPKPQKRRPPPPPSSDNERKPHLTGAPPRVRAPSNATSTIDDAVAEITARQRALDVGEDDLETTLRPTQEPTLDLGNLDKQLRDITTRIESLRPSNDLEASVAAIRADLTEIAGLITGALPRRAVESLEIEVKALAQRIEHSRQCGVDTAAVAGLERGLNEVRDALRSLTPAEKLVGFDDAVKALSQKVDMIVAKDDPAALQQLETAIGALRGIVSHVASNETLTKVAEDVRALAGKVDTLAIAAASSEGLSALENRIETLAHALTASAEAGQAVPRELEKLLTGLIEKLEWVQLTHTDHAALAHLEDRIATLVQRFDASDARFGHLEAVERGIADLLVHIDEIRAVSRNGAQNPMPIASVAIERDVAEIKQSELRTQDSLEAVQGTVEQVVDRLAIIESGIRDSAARTVQAPQPAVTAPPLSPVAAPFSTASIATPVALAAPIAPAAKPVPAATETAPPRPAGRTPIDPNLPPDHPLEPGSAPGRARPSASAADRIAASEAAVGSTKPPVIADPGEKPNFIAAARRAAQAAASAAPQSEGKSAVKGAATPTKPKQRTRTLIVAGAAALIVIGCIQIASRFFDGGTPVPSPAPADSQQDKASPPAAALPEPNDQAPAQTEPAPLPVPSAPPSTVPGPLPNPRSGALKSVPLALAPNTDVTGSLPHSAAPAPASATLGDKLPATIGGPTLRAAALSGDAAAAYEVAMRFTDGHGVPANNAEAALWLERAAKQGLAPAQFRLGGLYEKGLGVKKDLAAARDLYTAAANKGNGKAMHNLAVLYAEGVDGSPDYTNAAHWFRAAADHGITDSQYNLGILYARGIGVAQNFAESYKWFALAANQGDDDAGKKRDEVGAHLDQQSLSAAQLAVKTFTPEPQTDDAVTVKSPPGGWDVTQIGLPAAKPKPRQAGAKPPAADAKVN
jgi:localization factor PodJL